MSRLSRRHAVQFVLLALVVAAVAAGCGGDGGDGGSGAGDAAQGGGAAAKSQDVELTMWLFGDFGYDPLIEQYEQENPHVTITTKIAEFNAHHDALTTALASGAGAPDIAAIEVGFMSAFLAQPQHFANLLDLGAGELEDDYLDWRWQQALTPDGEALIGLPTDVGGMAIAYRHDLFEQAGLPADREQVSALWPTWEDFIATGQRFTAATKIPFIDEGSQLYNAIVNQGETKYYEKDGTLVHDSNPQVRRAWDVTVRAIEAGIVANIEPFAAEWNAGMNNGDFAVLTAPAWMMGYIQGQAPDTEGKWDIAAMPEGGGNWGGSHLAVPAQSEHAEEAYAFISWLLAPPQQLAVFRDNGNFPSTPAVYDSEEVQGFSNPFFNDAPVGPIYAENARKVTPIYEGPQEGAIRLAIENGLDRVEDGSESPERAWQTTLDAIEQEVGG